jgi:hypothetical protein
MRRRRWVGIVLLTLVVASVAIYSLVQTGTLSPGGLGGGDQAPVTLKGYVGGEKMGFLQDPEVLEILDRRYGITLDITKAGSIEMVRGETDGIDFLWPSSQVALEIYKTQGRPLASDQLIFNSPIVLYSWDIVADALKEEGIARQVDGVYYVNDLPALFDLVMDGQEWSDIGVSQLYGKVRIISTDPTKSNSGAQFSGLLANTLNEGRVVDDATIDQHLPAIEQFYGSLGFLHHSSGDLFSQYLKQGVGAYPLVVGYENQIIEFSLENKDALTLIQDRVRLLYPQPTVWSSHPLLALNDDARRLNDALMDPEVQSLAWSKHGFRTGLTNATDDPGVLRVAGIPTHIEQVIPMPKASVVDEIIRTQKSSLYHTRRQDHGQRNPSSARADRPGDRVLG